MKAKVETAKAPAAIGPYSQGIVVGDLVFVSGQLPIDPATGIMPATIEEQTRQALANVEQVLIAAGSGLDKICKTTVFLQDMNDFVPMNGVYAQVFEGTTFPARSAVEVAKVPKGAKLEIEAIACK